MVPAAQRQYTHSTNSLRGITWLGSFLTELINDDKQKVLKIIFLKKKKSIKSQSYLGMKTFSFTSFYFFALNFYDPKCLVLSILDILQHDPQGVT